MKDLDLAQLPSQSGKSIVVTGGTGGLGRQMVERLAALQPAAIYFTGRNHARAQDVLAELSAKAPAVQARFVDMDLASLAATQRACESLKPQLSGRLDLVICNAGIMAVPPGLSSDGYEIQWATNYLGHALLLKHLLPLLATTAKSQGDARLVTLTSEGLFLAPNDKGIVFADLKTKQEYGFGARWRRYGQSKLAQVLYTASIASLFPSISCVSIHPGVVGTDLVKTLGFADRLLVYTTSKVLSPEDGCKNPLWGATAARTSFTNGAYYAPVAEPGKETKWSKNQLLGEELWTWTERALEAYVV